MKLVPWCVPVLGVVVGLAVGCGGNASGEPGSGDPSAGTDPTHTSDAPPVDDEDAGVATPHAHDDAGETEPTSGEDAGAPAQTDAGAGGADGGAGDDAGAADATPADAGDAAAALGSSIASIALANVNLGACSQNSTGSDAFLTSCTGNDGSPEYWCADFAQWVWEQAGVDATDLDAAAGSFYTYGEVNGTLHTTPSLGDAVVFNYSGGGVAEHVAIIVQVNADGTIETVSGDWGGDGATEAAFASTSSSVLNTPAYAASIGAVPDIMGMTISAFVSPIGTGGLTSLPGGPSGTGCYSDTLGMQMPENACVQSASDSQWYQCDDGEWVDRDSDPVACDGTYPLN